MTVRIFDRLRRRCAVSGALGERPMRIRASSSRSLRMEPLEQRQLLDASGLDELVTLRLAAVPNPTPTDTATAPPESMPSAEFDSTYFVELWVQDGQADSPGLAGGRIDFLYDTEAADIADIHHGSQFTVAASGTVNESGGRVDDFGGGSVASGLGAGNWARLGYLEVVADEPGDVSYSLEAGSLPFARTSGQGNVPWETIDLSDAITVEHEGAVQVDMRVVTTPTATDALGQVDDLPDGAAFVHEWQSYFVEVWVSSPGSTEYVSGGTVDLNYDTQYSTAASIEYGPAFTDQQSGTIDDAAGLVDDLGGEAVSPGVASDGYALLARVAFEPTSEDQAPVDASGHTIGPYDLGLAISDPQLDLSVFGPGILREGEPVATSMWAVVYDLDDSDLIDFGDFAHFAASFQEPVGGTEPPYVWWADFDKAGSDAVDFGDFAYFANNFLLTEGGAEMPVFPESFPGAWQPAGDPAAGAAAGMGAIEGDTNDAGANAVVDPADGNGIPILASSLDEMVEEITVDVALAIVDTPSAGDAAAALPDSLEAIEVGSTYYVELWVQDLSAAGDGVAAGTVDLLYDTGPADATSLNHGGLFTWLSSGTIDDATGEVADFGGGTIELDQGVEPDWARLGYVTFTADTPGYVDFSLDPGSTPFSLFDGSGEIDWSQVDTSDVLTLHQQGTSKVDITIVAEPTATGDNGETDTLPDSLDEIGEWDSYYIELWVRSPEGSADGIASATVDLAFDPAYITAQAIEYGPAFTASQTGTVDNAAGTIDDLGGATTLTDVGDDRYVLLARIPMQPTAEDQVAMDLANNSAGPHNPGLALTDATVTRVNYGATIPELSVPSGIALYAVAYDANDSDEVDMADVNIWADAIGQMAGDPEPPYIAWADFDGSGQVDFNDLGLLADHYGEAKPEGAVAAMQGASPIMWLHGEGEIEDGSNGGTMGPMWIDPPTTPPPTDPNTPDGYPAVKLMGDAGAEVNVALVALDEASAADEFSELPDSIVHVGVGETFFLEVWVQDTGFDQGITGGQIDIAYHTDSLDPVGSLVHSDTLDLFPSGSIDDSSGLIDDFGGATLDGGLGVRPNWLRLGYVEMTVSSDGPVLIGPEPGNLQFAVFGTGNVAWDDVAMSGVALNLPSSLGPIEAELIEDIDLSGGERWLQGRATHSGFFTAAATGGDVNVAIYDLEGNLLDAAASVGGAARAEIQAVAGTKYLVKLTGTSADVDLRLVNLVTRHDTRVDVFGTSGNDEMVFDASTAGWSQVAIGGVDYSFDTASVEMVVFNGDAGQDKLTTYGSPGHDKLIMRRFEGAGWGPAYQLHYDSVEHVVAHGGPGADEVHLHDSFKTENLFTTPTSAEMRGPDFKNESFGFAYQHGYALNGGTDIAWMSDKPGTADTMLSNTETVRLYGEGHYSRAKMFEYTRPSATWGDGDVAQFLGVAGNDRVFAEPEYMRFYGAGYNVKASFFDERIATAGSDGIDVATFIGSAGDDVFEATPAYAQLTSDDAVTYSNRVEGFDYTRAKSNEGGDDEAFLYDSAGRDQFYGTPHTGRLFGDNFNNYAEGFAEIFAYATDGTLDLARLYDSTGNEIFEVDHDSGAMYSAAGAASPFRTEVYAFHYTYGFSSEGNDIAYMHDSPSQDRFYATETESRMVGNHGTPFYNRALHFDTVHATAGSNGEDEAELFGTMAADLLRAADDWAELTSPAGNLRLLQGFDRITVSPVPPGETQPAGAGDEKDVHPTVYDLALEGIWQDV